MQTPSVPHDAGDPKPHPRSDSPHVAGGTLTDGTGVHVAPGAGVYGGGTTDQ